MTSRVLLVPLLALTVGALVIVGCGSGSSTTSRPTATSTTTAVSTTAPPLVATTIVGAVDDGPLTTVAVALGSTVQVHARPDGPVTATLRSPQASGSPQVFTVTSMRRPWLKVNLPTRPNGSKGWVRDDQVRLSQHRFRIVVELNAHRITVYQGAVVRDQEPIAVGRSSTPTPGGVYYTKELFHPPNPAGAYGPYAYGLSGFSNVLHRFGGGDGVIGIHGTNQPQLLGTDVSHGCIRMSNAGITKLAALLPLGVPVEIRS
jgi:lipoprotein-anchoring transpeptidase ErfK/SrfK